MRETLRLSDAPEFHRILREFALRLNPELSVEDLVLASVRTTLRYHDGRTFLYTLDPANFRVEEDDAPVRTVSPINNSTQKRRVVYSIRSEDGTWHTPIGTTCILKDILGLDPRQTNAMGTVLLEAAHDAKQRDLLLQHGDDLRGYGRANGLQEGLITQMYLDSLRDEDPIREHLQRLLHTRIPLNRAGLRLLRAHSRRVTPAQVEAARTIPAVPVLELPQPISPRRVSMPPVDSGQRLLAREVVRHLQPHLALLLEVLPETLHAEVSALLTAEGERVPCTREVLDALREATGERLTVADVQERRERGRSFGDLTPELLTHWVELETHLEELTPLQKARWRHHLLEEQLTMYEWSCLREAWHHVRASTHPAVPRETGRNVQVTHLDTGVSPWPSVEEDVLLGHAEQRRWYDLRDRVRLHLRPEQAPLLERLNQMTLRLKDIPDLEQARRAAKRAKLPQIQALRLRPNFVRAVPEALQADFAVAVRDNNFPPHLRTALEETAEQLNLDASTLMPPQLEGNVRRALRLAWAHLTPHLGPDAEGLRRALDAHRYTIKQAAQLRGLVSTRLPETALPAEDRAYLRRNPAGWRGRFTANDYRWICEALEKREYTPRLLAALDGLVTQLKVQEEARQAKAARQAAEAAARAAQQQLKGAEELHERLLSRWGALRPQDARALRVLDPAVLMEALPDTCRAFQDNGARLTLDIEQAVRTYLARQSALGATPGP